MNNTTKIAGGALAGAVLSVVGMNLIDAEGTEFPVPQCYGDVDGNGVVDVTDLNVVLAEWGPCPEAPPPDPPALVLNGLTAEITGDVTQLPPGQVGVLLFWCPGYPIPCGGHLIDYDPPYELPAPTDAGHYATFGEIVVTQDGANTFTGLRAESSYTVEPFPLPPPSASFMAPLSVPVLTWSTDNEGKPRILTTNYSPLETYQSIERWADRNGNGQQDAGENWFERGYVTAGGRLVPRNSVEAEQDFAERMSSDPPDVWGWRELP